MAGKGDYRRLASQFAASDDGGPNYVDFVDAVGESASDVYQTIKNLTAVNVERAPIAGGDIGEFGGAGLGLSATNFDNVEEYVTYITEGDRYRTTSRLSIDRSAINLLEDDPSGDFARLLFEIYRYNILNASNSDQSARSLWTRDGGVYLPALVAGNSTQASERRAALRELTREGEAETERNTASLSGDAAVSFLLNRQQRVLATVNERIIEQFFDASMVAQDNIIKISSEDESLLINYLLKRPNLLPFFAIRTPYLSLLVPKIRLFKKVYERQDDGSFVAAGGLGTLEFKFKSFTENAEIEKITSDKFGRPGGAGIKSANWSYEGTNPEAVKSFVNFDISLFFQSLSDFIGSDTPSTNEALRNPENVDLISLIGAGIGVADETTGQTIFKFEITAELGWALDHSINHDLANDQEIDKLKRIIGETNTNLRLSLQEHNINFNEDGTLTLDISYFSAIDEVFTDESLNILRIGLAEGSAIQSIAEAKDNPDPSTPTREAGRIVRPELDPCPSSRRVTTGDEASDPEEEKPPTAEELAISAALQGSDDDSIIQNYNNIFSKLIEGNKIYRAVINVDEVSRVVVQGPRGLDRALVTEDDDDPVGNQEQMQNRANRRTVEARYLTEQHLRNISTGDNFSVERVPISSVAPLLAESDQASLNVAANDADIGLAGADVLSDINLGQAYRNQILANYSGDNGNTLRVDFIRLGDLLDNMINGLKEIPGSALGEREDDFVFLTGLYTYRETASGIRKAYNYSDMLISIDGFRSFFIEKIVRPLKVKYNLTSFMIDLANKFSYVNSVRLASQETFVSAEGRPTFATFQAPDVGLSESLRARALRDALTNFDFNRFHLSLSAAEPSYAGAVAGMTPTVPVSGEALREVSYFILRSSGDIIERDGDEDEDIEAGIYHLKIGSDKGILKSIKFRKDEIRGRREGRIVRAGGLNLAALREKYDATITIFGAPFIFPGMYIYVNPSLIGYGAGPDSAAQVLGLGGYYFINKVRNSINADGTFETEIEASWNAFAGTDCGRSALDIIQAPSSARNEMLPAGTAAAAADAAAGAAAEEEVQAQIEVITARGITPDIAEQAARGGGYR